jgi:4-hydroxy-2-oxoheptanedioate aldolase
MSEAARADIPAFENTFKRGLRGTRPLVGLWLQLADNLAAEAVAYSGYDWLLVDAEHAPNEIPTIAGQLQAIGLGRASAIVRPSTNDTVLFKRLLDIGAQTLIVPWVQSAEEAQRAVSAVRYPPGGVRGVASCNRGNRFGHVPDYFARANDEMCVVVQIETRAAVDRVREIAAVDGIDAVFVGPSDLAADLGHLGNPGHPEVQSAIDEVLGSARAAGKPAGIFAFGPDDARKRFEAGFRFASIGADLSAMIKACEAMLAAARA